MRIIEFSKQAKKFIATRIPKHNKQIGLKIIELQQNPLPNDSKKVKGFARFRRADIGEYRIIYRFNDKLLYIHIVGKRNDSDVYKKLLR